MHSLALHRQRGVEGELRGQRATYAEYLVRVGTELTEVRNGTLALMDENLIPSAITGESKVFYYKMKDDYYKIFAEFATGDVRARSPRMPVPLVPETPR